MQHYLERGRVSLGSWSIGYGLIIMVRWRVQLISNQVRVILKTPLNFINLVTGSNGILGLRDIG